jgi:hypothetical protein
MVSVATGFLKQENSALQKNRFLKIQITFSFLDENQERLTLLKKTVIVCDWKSRNATKK